MKAIEYLEEQKFSYDHFTELTSTGINPDNNHIAQFAENYHQAKLKLLGIGVVTKRLNWMVEEMDKAKPFSQSYNNLNERHSRLLEAKKILDKEGLWL